ncbi:MAG: aspartate/glutamate racemase family protein [Devosia sp.]|nr:aspartate/glutamate racemase family protein [Devosia sp.]
MSCRPRIALIHAVEVAMAPIRAAMAEGWPEAEVVNLLDDSLAPDRAAEAELSEAMTARIVGLARYAAGLGAEAVLFTCSAFGPAIERAAAELAIPVLKPNQAMFGAALAAGVHIGMLATFAPAVGGMEAEFAAEARRHASPADLTTIVVPEAMAALRRGDGETHDRLLAERAGALAHCDAVLLAHFSTSRAAAAVRGALRVPVLTSPEAAVAQLRRRLGAA